MGATNGLGLPFPELTEAADGPDAISDLANAVEDYVYDRILPAGVTRAPTYYWGSLNTLPTAGVRVGDTAFYALYGVLVVWNGAAWKQAEIPTVAANNTTPGFYFGQYRDVANKGLERWMGTIWAVPTIRPVFQGYANGAPQTGLVGWSNLRFDAENWDNFETHGGDPFAFVAPETGVYALEGVVAFEQDGTNPGRSARITVNGNIYANACGVQGNLGTIHCSAVTGRKIWYLNAGDVVRLQGWSTATWATRVDLPAGHTSSLTVERLINA